MRTVLYINDSYCFSLEQLYSYFSLELVPDTPLYEDLLIAQRDGELIKWLAEGGSKDEVKLLKELENLPTDISNSELVNSMKQIFVGDTQEIQKPHFSNYIKLQQIRCVANDSEVELIFEPQKYNNLLRHHPDFLDKYQERRLSNFEDTIKDFFPRHPNHNQYSGAIDVYEGYINKSDKESCVKLFLDFKIIKTDDEVFDVFFHGTHMLSLAGKSVGQIVTIESNPYIFTTEHAFDLTIEKERIGIVILYEAEWKVKVRDVEIEMVHVEGGTFTMGAALNQARGAESDEFPTHRVSLNSFNIGKYQVTQKLWKEVMGKNPSFFSYEGEMNPVELVSWKDCQEFIKELNRLTGKTFRLPTEAEWEFAARGGNYSRGYKYAGSNDIEYVAWCGTNTDGYRPHAVGELAPNELGIYDMSGNVYEWCQDVYAEYSDDCQNNPTGPIQGKTRVFRGGSIINTKEECRTSFRNYDDEESYKRAYIGLRLAL